MILTDKRIREDFERKRIADFNFKKVEISIRWRAVPTPIDVLILVYFIFIFGFVICQFHARIRSSLREVSDINVSCPCLERSEKEKHLACVIFSLSVSVCSERASRQLECSMNARHFESFIYPQVVLAQANKLTPLLHPQFAGLSSKREMRSDPWKRWHDSREWAYNDQGNSTILLYSVKHWMFQRILEK